MWDGGNDGLGDLKSSKDLTNTKLAKNQLVRPCLVDGTAGNLLIRQVLHEQIEALRRVVDRQNEMMAAMMKALAVTDLPRPNVERSKSAERRSLDRDRDQFTVGDSDEEEPRP